MFGTRYGEMVDRMADDYFRVRKGKQLPYEQDRREVKDDYNRRIQQGRNEKCNCGSEKKYKKCCGKVINKTD